MLAIPETYVYTFNQTKDLEASAGTYAVLLDNYIRPTFVESVTSVLSGAKHRRVSACNLTPGREGESEFLVSGASNNIPRFSFAFDGLAHLHGMPADQLVLGRKIANS